MLARAYGVAHVMQAIEKGHQVIVLGREVLGAGLRKGDAVSHAGFRRKSLGAIERRLVVIESEELRLWIGLRHDDRGSAMAAPDIGDLGAGFEFCFDSIELGNPVGNEVGVIPLPEETLSTR